MKCGFDEKVVVFGADHHNTLAVLRCLGRYGCKVLPLIHSSHADKKMCIAKSRYAKRMSVVNEEEKAVLGWLLDNKTAEKQVIFPCSDFAMQFVDTHCDVLKEYYVFPGFKEKAGLTADLMDKYAQNEFAKENNIAMAKTWNLVKAEKGFEIPSDVIYPCILKPTVSAKGSKGDICTAEKVEELRENLDKLCKKGYTEILLQQYLIKKSELLAIGCITETAPHFYGHILRKIREYPYPGGSTACGVTIEEEEIEGITKYILGILYEMGWRGMYDLEFFECDDGIYLNEINFRHSGVGQSLISEKVDAPYIHVLDMLEKPLPQQRRSKVGSIYIDDVADFLSRHHYKVSGFGILRCFFKAKAHSIFSFGDIGGFFGFFMPMITKKFKK